MLLLLFGSTWFLVGLTSILYPQDRFSSPGAGPDTLLQLLDGPELSLGWIICGGIAAGIGLLHDRRIVNKHEALGWNAILTMPLIWMICFIWSFGVWQLSDGMGGRSNALYATLVWLIISLVIMIVAGWPEEKFETRLRTSEIPEETEDKET